jgi:hypothetical protein
MKEKSNEYQLYRIITHFIDLKNEFIHTNHRESQKSEIEILFVLRFFYGLTLLSDSSSDGPYHCKTAACGYDT